MSKRVDLPVFLLNLGSLAIEGQHVLARLQSTFSLAGHQRETIPQISGELRLEEKAKKEKKERKGKGKKERISGKLTRTTPKIEIRKGS